ncbi:MAG: DUF6171 family protein [Clostridia bacterium]|nr:hypothetical protein [Clostridiales bacterium]MCR5803671.1 DUF6171 family protein [Clostridia bacterium]
MGKICRRCLLSDISKEQYEALIVEGLKALPKEDLVDDPSCSKRLEICRECEKLNEGTCLACGCFVEIRAALKKGRCPYNKW